LQISTPDQIGLVNKASGFIFQHGGSIITNTVRVIGDRAYLLLYFEAADCAIEKMHQAIADFPDFAEFEGVKLFDLHEPADEQPVPTVLEVVSQDLNGLLVKQTELIRSYQYTIVTHDGTVTYSDDDNPEYRQTIKLSIPPERLIERDPEGRLIWDIFKHDLNQMLESYGGRFSLGR
jgi:formyltetrahydrofolate hydrolase